MNHYYAAYGDIDLKCYPNYSFEIGDVDGDGKMEFISMDQSGNLLKVLNLDGELLFEKNLANNGNWGTPLVCAADIDGDGCDEIIVPNGHSVVAFDKKGNKIRERDFGECQKDVYQIAVPLLGVARVKSPNEPAVIAAVAGGSVCALDAEFGMIWKRDGFLRNYGHEIHFADVDGDGLDEIIFCSVGDNEGDLVLLDHDGTVLLRKRVGDYIEDSHFDDMAMADFTGDGSVQILVEKGVLLDLKGEVIWDLSDKMEHGQWIAHAQNPDGRGKICFISELWGNAMKSMLFSGQGEKIKDIGGFPWPAFDSEEQKSVNLIPLPSRCHAARWDPASEPEIFLSQQSLLPSPSHMCYRTVHFQANALFMDLRGNIVGNMPFGDAQIQGYYYNGEVHSKVADVDGDGEQEIVFPKQDGNVMVIKKRKI